MEEKTMTKAKLVSFENTLCGLQYNSVAVSALTETLRAEYSMKNILELISQPILRDEDIIKIILSLSDDGIVQDTYMDKLSYILLHESCFKTLNSAVKRLMQILKDNIGLFNRTQLIIIADTFEILYAREKQEDMKENLKYIFKHISIENRLMPNSEENIRIELSKIAYSCNKGNYNGSLNKIYDIQSRLKASGVRGLNGLVAYYSALCEETHTTWDVKGSEYMQKALRKGFYLAQIYCENE